MPRIRNNANRKIYVMVKIVVGRAEDKLDEFANMRTISNKFYAHNRSVQYRGNSKKYFELNFQWILMSNLTFDFGYYLVAMIRRGLSSTFNRGQYHK